MQALSPDFQTRIQKETGMGLEEENKQIQVPKLASKVQVEWPLGSSGRGEPK